MWPACYRSQVEGVGSMKTNNGNEATNYSCKEFLGPRRAQKNITTTSRQLIDEWFPKRLQDLINKVRARCNHDLSITTNNWQQAKLLTT